MSTDTSLTSDEYAGKLKGFGIDKRDIKGVAISSVVPQLCEIYKNAIKKYLSIEPISLSYKSKMPIKLNLKNNNLLFYLCDL